MAELFAEVKLNSVTRVSEDEVDIGVGYRMCNAEDVTLAATTRTFRRAPEDLPGNVLNLATDLMNDAIRWAQGEASVLALSAAIGGKKKQQFQT